MGKKTRFMDIRIEFKKRKEDEDYVYFEPTKAYRLATNIDDGDLYSVAEKWAQSDHYQLLSDDVIVTALGDGDDVLDLTR